GPAFGLPEAGHQQSAERDQARTRLAGRNAAGQGATGRATTAADQSVPLVFGDNRLDLRQFPNLMAEGFRIGAGQGGAATSAGGRHTGDNGAALLDRQEWPLVLGVAGLTARGSPRFGLGPWRL